MANPGKHFIEGDVIYDSSVPRERLIFAGVSGEKCFVHYEQGGRGHMYLVVFFEGDPKRSNAALARALQWSRREHQRPAISLPVTSSD